MDKEKITYKEKTPKIPWVEFKKLSLEEKEANIKNLKKLSFIELKKLDSKEKEEYYKYIRKFDLVAKKKREQEERIAKIDLKTLSKPVNDVATSGPKKMKDFRLWPFWKTALVGLAGVIFVILIWWLYSYLRESQGLTSWISSPSEVWHRFIEMAGSEDKFRLWKHLGQSMQRVLVGYLIACLTSIPIAFIMAWYKPVRAFLDPFIQFMRCIPPIAYVPIVVAAFSSYGSEMPKYFIIWMAVFLTMTVTIYQGVRNVDLTLVKAAYTFGARDKNLFTGVIVPSAFPFILTAMRLGIGAAMTTLVASELTGTNLGLGSFINTTGSNLQMDYAVMGIIVLGICGILLDKILLFVEKRLTRWK